jgi:hypothetical protein
VLTIPAVRDIGRVGFGTRITGWASTRATAVAGPSRLRTVPPLAEAPQGRIFGPEHNIDSFLHSVHVSSSTGFLVALSHGDLLLPVAPGPAGRYRVAVLFQVHHAHHMGDSGRE